MPPPAHRCARHSLAAGHRWTTASSGGGTQGIDDWLAVKLAVPGFVPEKPPFSGPFWIA